MKSIKYRLYFKILETRATFLFTHMQVVIMLLLGLLAKTVMEKSWKFWRLFCQDQDQGQDFIFVLEAPRDISTSGFGSYFRLQVIIGIAYRDSFFELAVTENFRFTVRILMIRSVILSFWLAILLSSMFLTLLIFTTNVRWNRLTHQTATGLGLL